MTMNWMYIIDQLFIRFVLIVNKYFLKLNFRVTVSPKSFQLQTAKFEENNRNKFEEAQICFNFVDFFPFIKV